MQRSVQSADQSATTPASVGAHEVAPSATVTPAVPRRHRAGIGGPSTPDIPAGDSTPTPARFAPTQTDLGSPIDPLTMFGVATEIEGSLIRAASFATLICDTLEFDAEDGDAALDAVNHAHALVFALRAEFGRLNELNGAIYAAGFAGQSIVAAEAAHV